MVRAVGMPRSFCFSSKGMMAGCPVSGLILALETAESESLSFLEMSNI